MQRCEIAQCHFQSGLAEWKIIWGTGAGVYIFTAVVFLMWGTGEIQEWNDSGDSTVPEENSKAACQQSPDTEMAENKNTRNDYSKCKRY